MGTVKELIEKLQKCNPDYIVKLADWNEGYSPANEKAAEEVFEYNEDQEVIIGE